METVSTTTVRYGISMQTPGKSLQWRLNRQSLQFFTGAFPSHQCRWCRLWHRLTDLSQYPTYCLGFGNQKNLCHPK